MLSPIVKLIEIVLKNNQINIAINVTLKNLLEYLIVPLDFIVSIPKYIK